ncbi:MAG: hypothetical protein AAFU55_00385 [Pseudomonadota bacterium]
MTHAATLRALLDETLDPADFTHEAHVGAAYEALAAQDFADALAAYSAGVRKLAGRSGAEGLFSATITFAYFSAIAERMRTTPRDGADAFIRANPDLLDGSFLSSRFSPDRLASPVAKAIPLLPDRAGA